MEHITYLHISGVLGENNRYRPRPGHESPRRGRPLDGDPAFQLVLLDHDGRVLLCGAPQVTARGCGHSYDSRGRRVRGVLPLHPDAVAYELRQGEIRLHRASISAALPTITRLTCEDRYGTLELKWHPGGQEAEKLTHAAGAKKDCDVHPSTLTYNLVAAMDSGRRITIARGMKNFSHAVDLSVLPVPGKGSLHLVVSDGVRSSETWVAAIDVAPRLPTVHILAPVDTSFPFGQALSLLGCCLDMSGQPCAPEHTAWYLDGQRIASGTLLAAHDGPSPGSHRLSFAFEPGDGVKVETSVTIDVGEPDAHHRRWEALMNNEAVAGGETKAS